MFVTQHKFKIIGLLAVLFLLINTTVASTPRFDDDRPDIKQQLEDVFEQTKSSTTAAHFTAILKECERISKLDLHEKQAEYLKSLAAWGHRRRAECRFAVAEELLRNADADTSATGDSAENAEPVEATSEEEVASNLQGAIEDFSAAIEGGNKPVRCLRYRAMAHCACGDFAAAISDFSEAIRLDPDHVSTRFNRAELYLATGEFQNAIDDYAEVLEKESADLQALTGRAHSLMGLGKPAEAMKDYSAVAILQSDDPVALINRGDCHHAMGSYDLALVDYKAAFAIEETADSCRRAAWLTATCPVNKFYEPGYAVEMAERAIELGGETALHFDTLAAASAAAGDFEAALEAQQKAIELLDEETASVLSGSELQARLALYQNGRPFRTKAVEQTGTETSSDR